MVKNVTKKIKKIPGARGGLEFYPAVLICYPAVFCEKLRTRRFWDPEVFLRHDIPWFLCFSVHDKALETTTVQHTIRCVT